MKSTESDRGFKHLEEIVCSYGSGVRVYESSAASQPYIWLRVEQGKHGSSLGEATAVAHLTLEQAIDLCGQLEWIIDHHYNV